MTTKLYRHWHLASETTDLTEVHDSHLVHLYMDCPDGALVTCLDDGDMFWAFPDELFTPKEPVNAPNPRTSPALILVLVTLVLLVGGVLGWLVQ